jgi:hypothetical protein
MQTNAFSNGSSDSRVSSETSPKACMYANRQSFISWLLFIFFSVMRFVAEIQISDLIAVPE